MDRQQKTPGGVSATQTFQIAIVGGGLAGFAAALACAHAGARTVLFAPPGPPDRRTSAVMMPTVDFLLAHDLVLPPDDWATPLREIRIIDATQRLVRAPETLFRAEEAGQVAFGYNFPNAQLLEGFAERAKVQQNLMIIEAAASGFERQDDGRYAIALPDGPTVKANLLVGADGRNSAVRSFAGIAAKRTPYPQSALAVDVSTSRSVGHCSTEFHYENGPFTLVPGRERAHLVWIDLPDTLRAAAGQEGDGLGDILARRSSNLFGRVTPLNRPAVFPLEQLSADEAARDGVVLVGEAGHAFPPIGAQGLNLGLRDVAALAALLETGLPESLADATRLARDYAEARKEDLERTTAFVGTLFRSLVEAWLPAQVLRGTGLAALRSSASLRERAMRFGMGRG